MVRLEGEGVLKNRVLPQFQERGGFLKMAFKTFSDFFFINIFIKIKSLTKKLGGLKKIESYLTYKVGGGVKMRVLPSKAFLI